MRGARALSSLSGWPPYARSAGSRYTRYRRLGAAKVRHKSKNILTTINNYYIQGNWIRCSNQQNQPVRLGHLGARCRHSRYPCAPARFISKPLAEAVVLDDLVSSGVRRVE